jgi:hypothetical protein
VNPHFFQPDSIDAKRGLRLLLIQKPKTQGKMGDFILLLSMMTVLIGLLHPVQDVQAIPDDGSAYVYFNNTIYNDENPLEFNEANCNSARMQFVVSVLDLAYTGYPFDIGYEIRLQGLENPVEPGVDIDPVLTGTTTIDSPLTVINPPGTTVFCDEINEPDKNLRIYLVRLPQTPSDVDVNSVVYAPGVIIDDDLPMLSINDGQVTEGDTGSRSISLSATLDIPSYRDIPVQFTTLDGSAVAGSDYVQSSGTLTMTAGTTSLSVPVQVLGDWVDENNETFTVQLTPQEGYAGLVDGVGQVTILDDDTAGMTAEPLEGLVTSEDGDTDSFTVRLDSQPVEAVTLTLRSDNPAEGIPQPEQLIFDALNWDTPRVVNVIGLDDTDAVLHDGPVPYFIEVDPSASTDAAYKNLPVVKVAVTNLDNEGRAFIPLMVREYRPPVDYFEPFDTAASIESWIPVRSTGSIDRWENGEYILGHTIENFNIRSLSPVPAIQKDYALEVKVRVTSIPGSVGWVGLVFDLLDNVQFYRFIINPQTREYRLQKFTSAGYVTIDSDMSADVNTGVASNLVRIERIGTQIYFYVNGVQLAASPVTDSSYLHGQVGIIMIRNDFGTTASTAAFDDFHVYELYD